MPDDSKETVWDWIGTAAIAVYGLPAGLFFFPYYQYLYAHEHGFMSWLLFGEIIATGKALAWPYFAFFG